MTNAMPFFCITIYFKNSAALPATRAVTEAIMFLSSAPSKSRPFAAMHSKLFMPYIAQSARR